MPALTETREMIVAERAASAQPEARVRVLENRATRQDRRFEALSLSINPLKQRVRETDALLRDLARRPWPYLQAASPVTMTKADRRAADHRGGDCRDVAYDNAKGEPAARHSPQMLSNSGSRPQERLGQLWHPHRWPQTSEKPSFHRKIGPVITDT